MALFHVHRTPAATGHVVEQDEVGVCRQRFLELRGVGHLDHDLLCHLRGRIRSVGLGKDSLPPRRDSRKSRGWFTFVPSCRGRTRRRPNDRQAGVAAVFRRGFNRHRLHQLNVFQIAMYLNLHKSAQEAAIQKRAAVTKTLQHPSQW